MIHKNNKKFTTVELKNVLMKKILKKINFFLFFIIIIIIHYYLLYKNSKTFKKLRSDI